MTYVLIKRTVNSSKLKTVSGNIQLSPNQSPQPLPLSPKLKSLCLSLKLSKTPTSSLSSEETVLLRPIQESRNQKILIRLLNPKLSKSPLLPIFPTFKIFTKTSSLTILKILKAKMDKILNLIWPIKKKHKIQKLIIQSPILM